MYIVYQVERTKRKCLQRITILQRQKEPPSTMGNSHMGFLKQT